MARFTITECPHTDKRHYALGRCCACYFRLIRKERSDRRKAERLIAEQEG